MRGWDLRVRATRGRAAKGRAAKGRFGQLGAIALSQALVAGGVIVGGVGAGVGLQAAGVFGSGTETVEVALDAVSVFDCPDGSASGELHRGDRVLATGRDEAGDWAEVRDPADLSGRVWIRAGYLVPDADLSGLDVHECATEDQAAPSQDTVPVGELPPEATTTTVKGGGPAPAADTAGPAITGVSASPNEIWETFPPQSCTTKATISASANDPSGVASLTASWAFGSINETKNVPAQFGPFPYLTVPDSPPYDHPVTVTITARDAVGNTSTTTTTVILNSAGDCFG